MPDKKKLTEITDPEILQGEEVASADGLSQRIADVESDGGDYTAVNPHTNALGKYQFVPSYHWDDIQKVTGVKDQREFLNSPRAQEDFFQWHKEHNLKPSVANIRQFNRSGYDDDQLARLVHFKGEKGAEKWLRGHVDDTTANNIPIDSYIGAPKGKNNLQEITDPDVLEGAEVTAAPDPQQSPAHPWESTTASVDMGPAQGVSVGVNGQNAPQATEATAPVLSTQGVTNNIFGTNVDDSPVVEDKTPAEPTMAERTRQSVDVLAKDYMDSQETHSPDMQEAFRGTALDHGDNPLNQITNPAGDPVYTSQYFQNRKAQLMKEQQAAINAQKYKDPSVQITIPLEYGKKIKELESAANQLTSVQLFNKEYADKPLTPAETDTQLDALTKQRDSELLDFNSKLKSEQEIEKQLLAKSFSSKKDSDPEVIKKAKEHSDIIQHLKDKIAYANKNYQSEAGKVKAQSKWDSVRLGIEQKRLMGDKQAGEDAASYDNGRPISPERRYQYQLSGNDIKKTGLAAAQDNGQQPVVDAATPHIETPKKIEDDNIDFLKSKWANDIANKKYNAEGKLASAIGSILPTDASISDEDMRKYGKEAGLTSSQINKIDPDEVPTPATIWQQFAKGALNTASPLYERAIRSAVALTGGDNEAVNEHFQPGWENKSGLGAAIVGNMPSDQNTFHNIRGAAGQIFEGAGGLATFMPEVEAVSGAIKGAGLVNDADKAEKLANFGTMAFTGYNSAYHDANEVIGDKPEDEWKRQAYALTNGLIEGAVFSISPKAKLAKNALGLEEKSGEQLLNEIKNADGLNFLQTPAFKEKIAHTVMAIAKENGTQVGLSVANDLSKHIINTITNPERRQDLSEDIKNTAISTSLAMMIPSIMGGIGHVSNQTRLNEAALFELGTNPDKYTSFISQQLADGKISNAQAQAMHDGILTMKNVISQTPTTNIEGVPMTPDQIKAYAFSQFQEHLLEQKVESLAKGAELAKIPVDKAQLAPLNKRISELQKQREGILKVAGTSRLPAPAGKEVTPEEHQGENDERSVAPEDKPGEAAPVAKKEEENIAETKKEDISLSSQNNQNSDVTSKTEKDENSNGFSRQGESNEGGQVSSEISEATGRGQDSEIRTTADGELPRVEEAGKLSEPTKENEIKAAPETEQPLVVKAKRKRREIFAEEEASAENHPAEVPEEAKPEPEKPVEDASIQSEGQQQKITEQSGEPEPARVEQAVSEETPAGAESGDSNIGGKEQEVTQEIPEGFSARKSNETRKDGKRIYTKEADGVKHEIVVQPDGKTHVESINEADFSGVDDHSKTAPTDIRNFDNLEDAVKHVNDYKAAENINNSEPAVERSVATEAPSEEPAPAAKSRTVRDVDLDLQKEKASLRSQVEKGKQAEKQRLAALKTGDKDAIARATEEANKRKDFAVKKQEKIDRLEEERQALADEETKSSYNKFADRIEQTYARNKERHKGEVYSSVAGINPKILDPVIDFIVSKTVSGLRAAGNLHVALRAAIREAKVKHPEAANEISDKDERALFDHLEHLKETPRHEPVLPVDHEEYAKDLMADIRSGEISYDEAVKEVNDEVIKNRAGDPVSDNVADKAKAKILNYIDWHSLDKDLNEIREKEEVRSAPNKIKASKLSESGMFSRYIGAETTRDVFGEEGHMDDMSENKNLQRLSDLMKDTQRFTNLYNDGQHPISEWGREMLGDIKDAPEDPRKQVAGLAGLNIELQAERIKGEKRLQELNQKISTTSDELSRHELMKQRADLLKERAKVISMIGEVQNYKKKVLSSASDVLNAGRVDRLMRNEVLYEHYEKSILSDKERAAKAELEKALQQSVMEDYRNHPEYKKEHSAEVEKEKSKKRKETEESKAKEPGEQKKKNVIRRIKEKVKKTTYEKGRKEAEQDFGVNDKGEKMTPKEFLEHLKKLKNPC